MNGVDNILTNVLMSLSLKCFIPSFKLHIPYKQIKDGVCGYIKSGCKCIPTLLEPIVGTPIYNESRAVQGSIASPKSRSNLNVFSSGTLLSEPTVALQCTAKSTEKK